MSTSDIVNSVAAGASAVAALASWTVAVRANRVAEEANEAAAQANQAAESANQTAEAVARIEHDRWHAELTPQFEVTATKLGPGVERASLHITLVGPTGLPDPIRVILRIRDDGYRHEASHLLTQEMIDRTIYGPYRFEPGIDEASADGRTVTSRPLALGDWDKFSLSLNSGPTWSDREYWTARYADDPIRLLLECHAEGYSPWRIAREVFATDPIEVHEP